MTPERMSSGPEGTYRFNRVFKGVGRIRQSSGTTNLKEYQARDGILTKLFKNAQIKVLRAFKNDDITIEQLVEADRTNTLKSSTLLAEIALRQELWTAMEAALPEMGKGIETRKRYATSLRKLRTKASKRIRLPVTATVANLRRTKWRLLQAEWNGGPADWNHLRRAISAFLTVHLGNVYHPFRRRVLKKIALRGEKARVPDISVETFWAIVAQAPTHAQPCYVTLAATAIEVPGTKTDESASRIFVDAELWPWIEQGIPSPLQYGWMRKYWMRACLAAGVARLEGTGAFRTVRVKRTTSGPYKAGETPQFEQREITRYTGPRLHDLRHLYAQLADEEGATETQVMSALRHSNPAQSREYKKRVAKGEVAKMVGNQLLRRIS